MKNVHLHKTNGMDLKGLPNDYFDFCFSFVVFQHIPHKHAVINYFHEVRRVLKAGGVFRFQVDGRIWDRARLDNAGTWAGVVFSEGEIIDALSCCDMEILELFGQETQYFWVTTRRRLQPKLIVSPLVKFVAPLRPPRPYNLSAVRAFFYRLSVENAGEWFGQFLKGAFTLYDAACFFADQFKELTPKEYVPQVYTTFLNRPPGPEECDFYTSSLVGGNSGRLEIAEVIMGTMEFSDILRVSSQGSTVA